MRSTADAIKGAGTGADGNCDGNISGALSDLAFQVKMLGGGLNTDSRGAIEVLAISVAEGCSAIADAINRLAEAVENKAS